MNKDYAYCVGPNYFGGRHSARIANGTYLSTPK